MEHGNRKFAAPRASCGRRAAYSLAAGAAAATGHADAAIVYSGPQNLPIAAGNRQDLTLDAIDARPDIQVKNYAFPNGSYQGAFLLRIYGRFVGFRDNKGPGGQDLGYASALEPGAMIDATTTHPDVPQASLAYGAQNPRAEFNAGADRYLGFRFRIGDPETATLHYAWMRVDIDNAAGTFVVKDWAYQSDPEVGILAGAGGLGDFDGNVAVNGHDFLLWQRELQGLTGEGSTTADLLAGWKLAFGVGGATAAAAAPTPEPGALGLLAAGAAGLALLRRRTAGHSHEY